MLVSFVFIAFVCLSIFPSRIFLFCLLMCMFIALVYLFIRNVSHQQSIFWWMPGSLLIKFHPIFLQEDMCIWGLRAHYSTNASLKVKTSSHPLPSELWNFVRNTKYKYKKIPIQILIQAQMHPWKSTQAVIRCLLNCETLLKIQNTNTKSANTNTNTSTNASLKVKTSSHMLPSESWNK